MPNDNEIAFWDGEAGLRWVAFAEQLDRAFAPIGAAALAAAQARPAEAVLDIGCGCGTSSLELAELVGPTGSVDGIDVSRPMLAVAERLARGRSLQNARFVLADASTYAFEEQTVDLSFSRFGVMFFDDPVAAFTNVRRSIRPDGRLVFACWRDLAANPWFAVPIEAVRRHLPAGPKPDPEAPGPLAFADARRVRGILERAGFADVSFEAFDATLSLGTRASALEMLREVGPAARLLAEGDHRERASALLALDEALGANERDGAVELGAGTWIVRALPAQD